MLKKLIMVIAVMVLSVLSVKQLFTDKKSEMTESEQVSDKDSDQLSTENPNKNIPHDEVNDTTKIQEQEDKESIKQPIEHDRERNIYYDNTKLITFDTKTNLLWAKCTIGNNIDEDDVFCDESLFQQYTYPESLKKIAELNANNYLGFNDWRMPTIIEMYNLIHCHEGFENTLSIPDKDNILKEVGISCKDMGSGMFVLPALTVPSIEFGISATGDDYWSASKKNQTDFWTINFYGARIHSHYRIDRHVGHIILVRDR